MSKPNMTYLSLGSNLGDRVENLLKARRLIEKRVGILARVSGLYETAPWGYESMYPFCNCCLSVSTSFEPVPLLEALLGIEKEMGRNRGVTSGRGYKDRQIDIDILYYGETVLRQPGLVLPHPSIPKRRFVLVPLAEIAPGLKDPVLGLTVTEMLEQCSDALPVTRIGDQERWNSKPSQNI